MGLDGCDFFEASVGGCGKIYFLSQPVILTWKYTIFSSVDESEDDEIETLVGEKYTIKSPHDLNLYTSFKLKHTSITGMNKLLLSLEVLEEDISSNVPRRVKGDCIIVVDLRKLEDKESITYDCWSWKNVKSYVVSGNENGPLKKMQW